MKRVLLFLLTLSCVVLFAAACQSEPVIVTKVVEITAEVTIVSQVIITTTPIPPTHTATPTTVPEPTPTPTIAPTRTLNPLQATQQAMIVMAQLPTANATTRAAIVSVENPPTLVNQVCEEVRELYVREDLNGVDWDAVCERYSNRATNLSNTDDIWPLLEELLLELQDPYVSLLTPAELDALANQPYPGGPEPNAGLVIQPAPEDEQLIVWHVCDTGAAAAAGIQRGDVILAIDQQILTPGPLGFDQDAVNLALYGSTGRKTAVTLTIQQGPNVEPKDVTLTFAPAEDCLGWQAGLLLEEPRLGYIRIPLFYSTVADGILEFLQSMEEPAPLEGLVLDMRHNMGGEVRIEGTEANDMVALFTQGNFGIISPLRPDFSIREFIVPGPVVWNETIPIVVITDGATTGSLEYFALAMQLSGRATIVGMPTLGQPFIRRTVFLAGGATMRVPFALLTLPDGTPFEYVGITPDLITPLGNWGLNQPFDPQLEAAFLTLVELIE